jgi:putative peptidoglycan lipid II flippase
VRERVFAHYFGDSAAADAFRAALKIPNIIRNLLGEGTLSASFIPVYAGLLERGDRDGARRVAGVIGSLLVLVTAGAALLGILLAPLITDFAAPGFDEQRRTLAITLVEIMFPMSGLMIVSAWCLGVLNTHRRFFLAYAAPSVWNIVQIGTLVALGGILLQQRLAVALAWGALAGSVVQIAIQLPSTVRLADGVRWSLALDAPGVRRVIRAWIPIVFGAGVYQISSLVDQQLATFLAPGAVAILGYAQLVAILPVSLFGVSVAAVALPELSRDAVSTDTEVLRSRVASATRRIAYFVLPSAAAFAALAPEILGALFQTGEFGADETALAAGVLAAYAIGIPAQASVKLFASGHYAVGDTRTPVRIAVLAVIVSAVSAFLLMQRFGPAGIALGAAIAAYVNGSLNFAALSRRLGRILDAGDRKWIGVSTVALLPAVAAGLGTAAVTGVNLQLQATAGLAAFGLAYGGVTLLLGHPEALRLARRGRDRGAQN